MTHTKNDELTRFYKALFSHCVYFYRPPWCDKRMGAPDVIIPIKNKTLAIYMRRADTDADPLTAGQQRHAAHLHAAGWQVLTTYGCAYALDILTKYGVLGVYDA